MTARRISGAAARMSAMYHRPHSAAATNAGHLSHNRLLKIQSRASLPRRDTALLGRNCSSDIPRETCGVDWGCLSERVIATGNRPRIEIPLDLLASGQPANGAGSRLRSILGNNHTKRRCRRRDSRMRSRTSWHVARAHPQTFAIGHRDARGSRHAGLRNSDPQLLFGSRPEWTWHAL